MKNVISLGFVAVILFCAAPAFSQLYIGLGVRVGPPPPRREAVAPRPHRGWVWVGGYYAWRRRAHRYAWVRGRWVKPPRAHAVWIEGRWAQRKGEWVYTEGRWADEQRPAEGPHRVRH